MARTPLNTRDPFAGYGLTSVVLHWLTAVAAVALFLTRGPDWAEIHLSVALLATPVFLFHVYWRIKRGFPRITDQPAFVNLIERLVILALFLCMLTVAVTGLAIPPLEGRPLAFFDIVSFAVPFPVDRASAEIVREVHDLAARAFLPLAALHILGALYHHAVRKDAVLMRMARPVPRGK